MCSLNPQVLLAAGDPVELGRRKVLRETKLYNSSMPRTVEVVTSRTSAIASVTQSGRPVAPPEGGKGEAPPYGWTSKNYVICVCFIVMELVHITRQIHCYRHIDPSSLPPVTKSWRRHCGQHRLPRLIELHAVTCWRKNE